ncbi:MAG TPA: acyltransferase [Rhizomicrobium sp.]|jgi:peptidoglycan/LPS O-acetylase OafA/YrhL|nr:acyltransferase [Rhizomicrobium sp.]
MSDKPAEIRALAGARAFPPLLLVMFHFSEGHGYRNFWPQDLLAARGYLWVEFFFCLSGFILTHVYGARRELLFTRAGYGNFLKARLTRLYPLHLFMLLTVLAMVIVTRSLGYLGHYPSIFDLKYHQDVSVKGFLLSLVLMHGWNLMDRLTWNGVSWFVSVEWALCLLFPIFLWLAKGKIWRGFALIAAGVAGLVALDLTSGAHIGLDITYHNGVLRGLSDFSVGVGLAVLYRAWKPKDRLPDWAHSLIQLAVAGALFYALYNTGWSHTSMDIFTVLPMLALVLALAFDRGVIAALLKMRLPQRLGNWSYAVYIGQTFGLLLIRVFEQRLYPPPMTPVLGTTFLSLSWRLEPLCLVLFCIAWGAFLATIVEHPVAGGLRRRLDRPRARASS